MSTAETTWDVPPTAAGGRRPPRRLLLGMMVAVFFSGGVIGSGATLIINRRIEEDVKRHDPMIVGHRVAAELQEELSLSHEQAAQVDRIMKDHLAAMDRLRHEVFFVEIRKAFKQMNDDIASVLDEGQRVKWNAWLEERRKKVCPPGDHSRYGHGRFRKSATSGTESRAHRDSPNSDAQPTREPQSETGAGQDSASS